MFRSVILSALVAPAVAEVRSAEAVCSEGTCSEPQRENLLLQVEHVANVWKLDGAAEEELDAASAVLPLKSQVNDSHAIGLLEEMFSARPTNKEWEHFQLVKQARQKGFRCPDGTYYPPNNGEFVFDCRLMRAARGWSYRMATENFAGHQYGGSTSCQRTEAEGYPKNRGCGENLALGKPGAAEAIKQLQESNGHCKNMYEPDFNHFGSGFFEYSQAKYRYYWTDAFGAWHQGPDQACIGGSPAPSPAPGCADIDTSNCKLYKSQGYCDKSPTVMQDCRETCNIDGCGSAQSAPSPQRQPSAAGCQDTADHCAFYKGEGYCSTSQSVKDGCKKTCGFCSSASATKSAAGCQDTADHCAFYKGEGYCNTSPNVKTGCRQTCGFC